MDEILRPKVRLAGEWFFRHQPLLFAPLLSGGRNGGTNAGRSDTSGRGLHVPCCRSCRYCAHSIAVAGLMFFLIVNTVTSLTILTDLTGLMFMPS